MFLFFLVGNGVLFHKPTDEEWYRTRKTAVNITHSVAQDEIYERQYYAPKEPASPLACTDQYQYCRMTTQYGRICGPVGSLLDAMNGAAPLFNSSVEKQVQMDESTLDSVTNSVEARWLYFTMILRQTPRLLGDAIMRLGATALHSQRTLVNGLQGPLEKNQWQLDMTHCWDISRAVTQAAFINAVYGPTDPNLLLTRDKFPAPLEGFCDSQVCHPFPLGYLAAGCIENLYTAFQSEANEGPSENPKHGLCISKRLRSLLHNNRWHSYHVDFLYP